MCAISGRGRGRFESNFFGQDYAAKSLDSSLHRAMPPIALDAVRVHLDTAIARKRTRPMSSGAYRIQAMVDGLDQVAGRPRPGRRPHGAQVGRQPARSLVSDSSSRARKTTFASIATHEARLVDARSRRAQGRRENRSHPKCGSACFRQPARSCRSFAPSSKHITSPTRSQS